MRHHVFLLGTLLAAACTDAHDHDESAAYEEAFEENQQEGKADGTDCSGVRLADRSGFNKRIALTFDDGPEPATTPQVIEVLKRHGAPATFFVNGKDLRSARGRELAAQIAADPDFILASHAYSHENLRDMANQQGGLARVADEMDRTATGVRNAGETMKYFRFPYGASSCATMNLVRERGWTSVGWTIDTADWCFAKDGGICTYETFRHVPDAYRNDILDYIRFQLRASNGGVMLFHDVHQFTASNLDRILTELAADGYTFVRLDDESAFPRTNGVTPKFIGDACTTNAQCTFMVNGQAGRCSAGGFCTISCAGSCPDLAGKAPTFCIADATTPSAGLCVSKAHTLNGSCAALPGTVRRDADRFIGTSSSAPARANVCAPR